MLSFISYQNLFSARKLRPETQSEARLDDKVLVVLSLIRRRFWGGGRLSGGRCSDTVRPTGERRTLRHRNFRGDENRGQPSHSVVPGIHHAWLTPIVCCVLIGS